MEQGCSFGFFKRMNDRLTSKLGLWLGLAIPYVILSAWSMGSFVANQSDCGSSHQVVAPPVIAPPVPDFQQIAALASGGLGTMPTPEQQQEQQEIERQQVAQAKQWLTSPDEELRIKGAEQLSAYPDREAALSLIKALKSDASSDVRVAAATSLGYFEPSKSNIFIINELFSALSDRHEQVAIAAFSSLQNLMTNADVDVKLTKQLMTKLKSLVKKSRLSEVTRQMIEDFLQDQQGL